MGKIIYVILLLFFLSSISCSTKNKKNRDNFININIDTLNTEEPICFSKIFTDFEIIFLETKEESIIDRIQNVKYNEGKFYIFDGFKLKTLYIFSNKGRYINKICKIGKGPGEYINPINFDYDIKNQNILLFDWASQKLNIYDINGKFKEDINIKNRFTSFIYNEDNVFFFRASPQNTNDNEACLLYKYNMSGAILSKYFDFMEYGYGFKLNDISPRGNFFISKNDIKFFMPLCDTIFSIKNNQIRPFVVLNSDKFKINKKDIIGLKKGVNMSIAQQLKGLNKLFNIEDYAEFSNMFFLKFNIGHKQFIILYNMSTGNIICSSKRIDDLTYISPDIFMINDHQFAGILYQRMIPKFIESVSSGKVKLSIEDKELILKKSEFDNPLLIIYNVKQDKP